jgi:hypothetical protein
MDFNTFLKSVEGNLPPASVSVYLRALWYDAKGDWDKSHEVIQDVPDKKASWIHAYLHRKEGDNWNANYWYNKAGRNMPDQSLQEEWEFIAKEMLPH